MPKTRPFVLVVDDEHLIADTLVLVLKQHGFDAVACYSLDDALTILNTFRPDFLVSDVVLNAGTGLDIAIATRQLVPSCQVILISGNVATADLLEQAAQSGYSFTCLAKPIHPQELLAQMSAPAPEKPRQFPTA
ncbi:MAG: response regulator [Terriglobia bacterium]|jgi:DNA-binding response OmpR family regulator|nr:response regulator [Terriglobia bacterium]